MKKPLDFTNCWINGRTLRLALEETGANHKLSPFGPTDRVVIDPHKDAYLLGAEFQNPFPFCTGNGVMATVLDMDLTTTQIYEFGLFQCTASAFESSLHWIQKEDSTTQAVEALGRKVLAGAWGECREFSREVCDWGGGERVWGNLNRYCSPDALQVELHQWFSSVDVAGGKSSAIERGLGIKGLSISFASKHLRLLEPDHYAVLDDVLSLGLGFALNQAGYYLFMHQLKRFKEKYVIPHSLAKIESAIFGLVRQSVRGQAASIN